MHSRSPNICMVHPNPDSRIETFIDAHGKRLPSVVAVLHGGHMPIYENACMTPCRDLLHGCDDLFSPDGILHTEQQKEASSRLADYLTAKKVEVVLAEYGPTGVALLNPCRMASIPLVVHFHGYDASMQTVIDKYRQGYTRLFRDAAAVICVSSKMEQDLKRLRVPEDKLHLNPYGVDTDIFVGADPETARPHFIGVGRLVDKKSPHLTIRAFAPVARRFPDARLTLVGEGPLLEPCTKLAEELGISDQVCLTGAQPHAEVSRLMRQARAYVQHSVTAPSGDSEGTPNAVLEAGSTGLPVVSTLHAGIPEVVVHGKTGLLCKELDVETMTENLMTMAGNPVLAGEMGRNGRERMIAEFDIRNRLASLASIIEKAARNRKPHTAMSAPPSEGVTLSGA